ncbi:oxidoreductase [Aliarcobacter cryaerophilus ATCC 43158]|uniref:Quinone oxidoreductase, YhdH/YhfP family n=1 Tax=Aliarcobacter cryaerophilus ATCC 43158 TaxID=1032070 RepID=A0AAD0TWQ9_9BACT|nr:YhdH/YhfP family quinone oxidoreductase [Aliarcobacter cryaerophilus]AYJ81064.1 quinone oxidoreductase, YhdH/YhfP family [Aliarcobacter cryaerophilus ATCC 43158]PRM98076.1 oxidoreductase [Aliarcobacter cryaerophilus]QCZ23382.1 oxidoreductase [Aliarcobacter cryaerophilus ATCC 43158]
MKAFVVEKNHNDEIISSVKDVEKPICGENEVIIKATYSSLNYKDALSSVGNPGVTRVFPHITGVDVAGEIVETKSNIFKVGQKVIVTGYDLGMNTNGGHSQFVKVPASWLVSIPSALSEKEAMIYGTAGLTAALSINELINNKITQESGDILVTGATGGVGSLAVAILSKLGFNVVALSGKEKKIDFLKNIGASEVVLREEFLKDSSKAFLKPRFAGVIDTTGGDILSIALKQTNYDGVVTCCGLTASSSLNTNIFPFILRGVRLIGIDSVECSLDKKQDAWEKLASKYSVKNLNEITNEISLDGIKYAYEKLLNGTAVGRYLVRIES